MKTYLRFGFAASAVCVAFYLGYETGTYKMWAHSKSWEASSLAFDMKKQYKYEKFQSAEELHEYLKDSLFQNLDQSFYDYGKYLSHWTSSIPIDRRLDKDTKHGFGKASGMYLIRRSPPATNIEASVQKIIDEMLEAGEVEVEQSDQLTDYLIERSRDRQANIARALQHLGKE